MNESNIQQNTGKPNDEIDIFEVGSRTWGAFKKLLIGIKDLISFLIILTKDIILSIIIFILRKSLWIASFTVVGMIFGYMLFNVQRPSYLYISEGETGGIDNTVVIDHVNRLDQLIGDTLQLAHYLNLSYEQAKKIRSIKACYGIDINGDGKPDYIDITGKKYRHKDSTQIRLPSFVQFRVSLYDKDILSVVSEGLFEYIKNNTYIQNLYKIDKEQRETLIKGLDKEIARLEKIDSVQRSRIRSKDELNTEKGQMIFLNHNEPEIRLLYTDILLLFSQKQELQRHIDLIREPVLIVHNFIPTNQKERPLLWYFIRYGGLMAILGIVCAMIWQYHRKIWELLKEDSGKKILEQIREDSTKYKL